MRLKAVLFDLDDTLYPSEEMYERGLRASFAVLRRTHPMSWKRFLSLYARARRETKNVLGKSPSARNRFIYLKRLVEAVEKKSDPRLTLKLMSAYDSVWHRADVSAVRSLAAWLSRSYSLGVVTNQVTIMQLQKMSILDPEGKFFRVLVTSEEAGVEKPHARIYAEACRRMACRPGEAVMVGNDWNHDVEGARRAGLRAIYFGRPPSARKAGRVPCIQALSELPAALNLLEGK